MSERLSRDVEMQNMGSTASEYADTEPIGQENPDEGVEGPAKARLRAPERLYVVKMYKVLSRANFWAAIVCMVGMLSFVLTYGIAWVSGSRSIGLIAWGLVILFTSIGFLVDFNLKNVYVSDCAKFSLVLCLWIVYYMDAHYFPEKKGARGWEDSPVTWPDFDVVDKDHSGFITLPEVCVYISLSGRLITPQECVDNKKSFDLWDENRDGFWSKEEYDKNRVLADLRPKNVAVVGLIVFCAQNILLLFCFCFCCPCLTIVVGQGLFHFRQEGLVLDYIVKQEVEMHGERLAGPGIHSRQFSLRLGIVLLLCAFYPLLLRSVISLSIDTERSTPSVTWPDFDFIDKDHSGFITLPDMCAYRRCNVCPRHFTFSDKECVYFSDECVIEQSDKCVKNNKKVFDCWDENRDGFWSKEEYDRLRVLAHFLTSNDDALRDTDLATKGPAPPVNCPDFDVFDKDHSGFITLPEVCTEQSLSDKECEDIQEGFDLFDKNHDGKWSKEEYERHHVVCDFLSVHAEMLAMGLITALSICFTCLGVPCFCFGRWQRIRRERVLMQNHEQRLKRSVEMHGIGSEYAETNPSNHVKPGDGAVGLGMSERLLGDVKMYGMGNEYAEADPIDQIKPDEGIVGPGNFERCLSFCLVISFSVWTGCAVMIFGGPFLHLGALLSILIFFTFTFLFWFLPFLAYSHWGCCGGHGVLRSRSALPPVAVLVQNEAIVRGRHVETAQLRTIQRPLWELVFLPVMVAENLERRPPRRPKGTVKVMMPRRQTPTTGALYVVSLTCGLTYFRVPPGTKSGSTVYVKLPDVFDDGTVWGDSAVRRPEIASTVGVNTDGTSAAPFSAPVRSVLPPGQLRCFSCAMLMAYPPNVLQVKCPGCSSVNCTPPAEAQSDQRVSQMVMDMKDVVEVMQSSEWKNAEMSTLSGQLSRVRQISNSGHPRMKVITASKLRKLKRLPRSSEGLADDLELLLQEHGPEKWDDPLTKAPHETADKPSLVVVFFSHKWFRGNGGGPDGNSHPDNAAGQKAMAMVQFADWLMWRQKASAPISRQDVLDAMTACCACGHLDVHTVDLKNERRQFGGSMWGLKKHQLGILGGIELPHFISDVAFWLDYNSVDQDNTTPGICALPLYVGACPVILYHETEGYEDRAWTRIERVLSYTYSQSFITVSIKSGFLHRKQLAKQEKRTLQDPSQGSITKESDRALINMLCNTAVISSSGKVQLGCTEVDTFCLMNDDDLDEISLSEAWMAWIQE